MAHQGETITNPVDGQRITFLRTVEDADERESAELIIEYRIPAGNPAVPAHIHLVTEETFEVRSGTLGVWVGSPKNQRTLGPGEQVTLHPRVAHRHWNAGADDLQVVETFRPARNLELGFQATFGLGRDGKANQQGLPKNALDTLLILQLLGICPAGLPIPISSALVRGGATFARLLSRPGSFPQYTGLKVTLVPVS